MIEISLVKKIKDLDFVPSFATDLDLVQLTLLARLTLYPQIRILLAVWFSFISFCRDLQAESIGKY